MSRFVRFTATSDGYALGVKTAARFAGNGSEREQSCRGNNRQGWQQKGGEQLTDEDKSSRQQSRPVQTWDYNEENYQRWGESELCWETRWRLWLNQGGNCRSRGLTAESFWWSGITLRWIMFSWVNRDTAQTSVWTLTRPSLSLDLFSFRAVLTCCCVWDQHLTPWG